MRWTFQCVALLVAVVFQIQLPSAHWMGDVKCPLVLSCVMYYAMAHERGYWVVLLGLVPSCFWLWHGSPPDFVVDWSSMLPCPVLCWRSSLTFYSLSCFGRFFITPGLGGWAGGLAFSG
jgi:hypothetical protein